MLDRRYSDLCSWLGFLGWCLTMSSLWLLPAYAIYKYNITEVIIVCFLVCFYPHCGCSLLKSMYNITAVIIVKYNITQLGEFT